MSFQFAERVRLVQSSAVREILKVTAQPDVISFAGGLPAPELFPAEAIKKAYQQVLSEEAPSALQYSTTEGYLPLREFLAARMHALGCRQVTSAHILITNGSQQALDLLAKLFINPGDTVLVESPTYLAALQTLHSYQAHLVSLPVDAGGMVVENLEDVIVRYNPRLIYTVPNFQNPTGTTLSPDRRQHLARVAGAHRIPVIEDDPYGELIYEGYPLPPVKSFDQEDTIIYLSTFSKTIAPGLRLGWAIGNHEAISKMVLLKQCTDLHTSTVTQQVTYRYLVDNDTEQHVQKLRQEYRKRRDVMLEELAAWFPHEARWTNPRGGMFLWVTLPAGIDCQALLPTAVSHRVAYVPGAPFFPNGGGRNTMRLNFSNSLPEHISLGVKRLGNLIAGVAPDSGGADAFPPLA